MIFDDQSVLLRWWYMFFWQILSVRWDCFASRLTIVRFSFG